MDWNLTLSVASVAAVGFAWMWLLITNMRYIDPETLLRDSLPPLEREDRQAMVLAAVIPGCLAAILAYFTSWPWWSMAIGAVALPPAIVLVITVSFYVMDIAWSVQYLAGDLIKKIFGRKKTA